MVVMFMVLDSCGCSEDGSNSTRRERVVTLAAGNTSCKAHSSLTPCMAGPFLTLSHVHALHLLHLLLQHTAPRREQRIRAVAEAAPWKLCGNERHMVLPPEVAARLNWGLLAAGSWFSRRPTRWLKVRLRGGQSSTGGSDNSCSGSSAGSRSGCQLAR